MRVVLSLVLLLSVVACVCVGQSTTGLLMGGFRDVEVTRSDVKRAVMFSMTDVGLRQGSDASLLKVGESLLHVHSARTQLVAGLKYEIVFETELGCFQANIFRDLQQNFHLTGIQKLEKCVSKPAPTNPSSAPTSPSSDATSTTDNTEGKGKSSNM